MYSEKQYLKYMAVFYRLFQVSVSCLITVVFIIIILKKFFVTILTNIIISVYLFILFLGGIGKMYNNWLLVWYVLFYNFNKKIKHNNILNVFM